MIITQSDFRKLWHILCYDYQKIKTLIKMKKHTLTLILCFVYMAIVYLVASFVSLTFDFTLWSEVTRVVCSIIWGALTGVTAIYYAVDKILYLPTP